MKAAYLKLKKWRVWLGTRKSFHSGQVHAVNFLEKVVPVDVLDKLDISGYVRLFSSTSQRTDFVRRLCSVPRRAPIAWFFPYKSGRRPYLFLYRKFQTEHFVQSFYNQNPKCRALQGLSNGTNIYFNPLKLTEVIGSESRPTLPYFVEKCN